METVHYTHTKKEKKKKKKEKKERKKKEERLNKVQPQNLRGEKGTGMESQN